MNGRLFPKKYDTLFIACLLLLFFNLLIACFFSYIATNSQQQFSLLAQSFNQGKFYFLDSTNIIEDAVYWNGKFYWPLSPFPAIVLMPFVYLFSIFNSFFYQGYLQFVLNIWIFYLVYKLAIKRGWKTHDSVFLAFGFMFASVYQILAIMSWSWYFVQVLCTLLLLLAIHEYLERKRVLLIGVYLALLFMSRFTAGLGAVFFAAMVLSDVSNRHKLKDALLMFFPIAISGAVLLLYNYLRFGDIWQNGYDLANNLITNESQRYELFNHGLFKLSNIPTNFYYYFIKTLDPIKVGVTSLFGNTHFLEFPYVTLEYPGTSFFVVSPFFLYIFRTDVRKKIVTASIYTILVVVAILLCYYWPGWRQVGPRYIVDVLPFIYILLINSFRKLSLGIFSKILILASSIFNFYLFFTIFNG